MQDMVGCVALRRLDLQLIHEERYVQGLLHRIFDAAAVIPHRFQFRKLLLAVTFNHDLPGIEATISAAFFIRGRQRKNIFETARAENFYGTVNLGLLSATPLHRTDLGIKDVQDILRVAGDDDFGLFCHEVLGLKSFTALKLEQS